MSEVRFPALVVDSHGWIELLDEDSRLTCWNYLGISNYRRQQKKIYLLDSNDSYWKISDIIPDKPLTGFRLFLASTIYNPRVSVKYKTQQFKEGAHSEFFEALKKNLENDDDVYTQYSDTREILSAINANQSFNELTNTLKSTGAL